MGLYTQGQIRLKHVMMHLYITGAQREFQVSLKQYILVSTLITKQYSGSGRTEFYFFLKSKLQAEDGMKIRERNIILG